MHFCEVLKVFQLDSTENFAKFFEKSMDGPTKHWLTSTLDFFFVFIGQKVLVRNLFPSNDSPPPHMSQFLSYKLGHFDVTMRFLISTPCNECKQVFYHGFFHNKVVSFLFLE